MPADDLPVVTHWVDGKPAQADVDAHGDVFDPATGRVTKHVAFASADDVDAAVAAASAAFASWRATSLAERTQGPVPVPRAARTSAPTSSPRSSPPSTARCSSDALGEVARGLEVVEFACGMPQLLKGGYSEGVSTRVDVYSIRQPLGVVAIISPFNFPAMVPCWFFPIAIATGQHRDPQAEREGSVGRELARGAVGRGRASRRACSTSCTATRSRSTGCSSTPT